MSNRTEAPKSLVLKESLIAQIELQISTLIGQIIQNFRVLPDGFTAMNGPYTVQVHAHQNEIGETVKSVKASLTDGTAQADITEYNVLGLDGTRHIMVDKVLYGRGEYITRISTDENGTVLLKERLDDRHGEKPGIGSDESLIEAVKKRGADSVRRQIENG